MKFAEWLDTFIDEKGIDTEHVFDVETEDFWQHHSVPLAVVVEFAKAASPSDQAKIKSILVGIDFKAGDPMHFFAHLAKGVALSAS